MQEVGEMIDTSNMRASAWRSIGVGLLTTPLGMLMVYGGLVTAFDVRSSAGVDDPLLRVAFHLGLPVVVGIFGLLLAMPLISGIGMLQTAYKAEHTAGVLDGRFYLDEDGNSNQGSLTHYDYVKGIVWEEWEDQEGYHKRTVRKLNKAELREDEILRSGGYGGMGGEM
jgi:hypothetical protein